MSNKKKTRMANALDALCDLKMNAEGIEGLMFILCDALENSDYESNDYVGAVNAIHFQSYHHLELLRILESKLKKYMST